MSRLEKIGKGVAVAALGLFGVNLLPHFKPTISHRVYKSQDEQVPVPLANHVSSIARAMNLPNPDNIDVFVNKGFTAVSGGYTALPNGATVGLPRTFLFESAQDVVRSGVTLQGNSIDWDSPTGKEIQDILVPSGQHMNFVIAHELSHVRSKDFLLVSCLSPLTLLLSYAAARTLPKTLPPRFSAPAVPAIFVVCLLLYFQLQSFVGRWLEFRADKMAALSHPSYHEGGIEYMKKNLSLQSFMENGGRSSSSLNPMASSHPTFEERLQRLLEIRASHPEL